MKNILLLIFLLLSNIFFTQTIYGKDLKETKSFVNELLNKNSSKIENFVMLDDGRIMRSKTDNPMEEFEENWNYFYKIIRRNDKIVFISKSDNMWGGFGDWYDAQDFYFNDKGVLIGVEKRLDFFLEETKCASQIKYRAYYENINTQKLEKAEKIFNMSGKEINLESTNCKSSKKQILTNIEEIEKITFRDLKGFMIANKIKFY